MIVVKFGGNAMADENGNFARAIVAALSKGEKVVVVHGGGPQVDAELVRRDIPTKFVGGFRVTTAEIFNVVEQVLAREVGPRIADLLRDAGVNAQAMSARDLPTLIATTRKKIIDGTEVDLGLVGEVTSVNPGQLLDLLAKGVVPVVAPVSSAEDLVTGLNVNGDFAAAAIASALEASALIVMTNVAGIYRNWPDPDSLISNISANELEKIKSSFSEGMAPKVQAALDAISYGAKAVRIIDGTDPESFALALAGQGGTLVVA